MTRCYSLTLIGRIFTVGGVVLMCFSTIGCSPNRKFTSATDSTQNSCFSTQYSYGVSEMPPDYNSIARDSVLDSHFSEKALHVAHAFGLTQDFHSYSELSRISNSQSITSRMDLLELSQRINNKINLASLEISAIASAIDCEEERLDQVAKYLENKEDDLERKLTVGAIIVGASGAIAQGILISKHDTTDASDLVGIASGLAEATLGLLLFFYEKSIEFDHPRNALREIWEGAPTSTIFPPSIWYYLNSINTGKSSPRNELVEKWIAFGQIDTKSKEQKRFNLNFTDGGKYTTEELKNRSSMYDQIESQIKLIKQDITILAQEFQAFEENRNQRSVNLPKK